MVRHFASPLDGDSAWFIKRDDVVIAIEDEGIYKSGIFCRWGDFLFLPFMGFFIISLLRVLFLAYFLHEFGWQAQRVALCEAHCRFCAPAIEANLSASDQFMAVSVWEFGIVFFEPFF